MADDLKIERCKLEETAMAGFSDELILEIVRRLPLKYVVQCSVLNKRMRRWIHQPNFFRFYPTLFHCSVCAPKNFITIWGEIRSTNVRPLIRSVTLPERIRIVASCDGLLLLSFATSCSYYIFNPATSGIAVVNDLEFHWGDLVVGLAVLDNSRFKLVSVVVDIGIKLLKFTVFVPSARSGESMSVESRINFTCLERLTLMTGDRFRPVYAHGALYCLGNDGRSMVEFDVEKEEVRIVGGPVERDELNRFCKWFGFADGSIHLVYESPLEIEIRQYDHVSRRWRVRCTIPNFRNNFRHGTPVFFDGRRLVFVLRKIGEFWMVYTYDFVRDLWEMIGNFAPWSGWHESFFSYSPTFVKVSDTYLNGKNTSSWENEGRRNSLLELQKLLIPA